MTPFTFARATSVQDAHRLSAPAGHRLLGGGTNLVDLMRKGIEHPTALVDVTALSTLISETGDGSLLIGAAVRNTALASHPLVRTRYPVLSRAILAGASAQIRNMATVAGNIMQRTRCAYFNDAAGSRCNKRVPGSGCDAREGFNRYNAIIGGSPACISVHPSDMCVALVALDAQVHLTGEGGTRTVPLADFYRLPGTTPELETVMTPGDVITAIELPQSQVAVLSDYRKVRDRASYAFALVSVAACVSLREGVLTDMRLAFGGIAPKPWRARRAEQALLGGPVTPEAVAAALDREFDMAEPLAGNAFKLDLARRTASAVLAGVAGLAGETS
jgi:xanthine dehydrogenase YagS FAD-binding subunit